MLARHQERLNDSRKALRCSFHLYQETAAVAADGLNDVLRRSEGLLARSRMLLQARREDETFWMIRL